MQLLYQKKHIGCNSPLQKTFQSRQFSPLPPPMYIKNFVIQLDFLSFFSKLISIYRNAACKSLALGCPRSFQESSVYLPRTMKLPGGYECLPATIHSSKASINSRLTLSKSMTDIVFNTALLTPGKKEKKTCSKSMSCKKHLWMHGTSLKSTWLKAEEGRSPLCLKQRRDTERKGELTRHLKRGGKKQ